MGMCERVCAGAWVRVFGRQVLQAAGQEETACQCAGTVVSRVRVWQLM